MINPTDEAAEQIAEKHVDASIGSQAGEEGNNNEAPVNELNFRSGLALLASFMAYFVTVGFLNAYGVFQQYYTAHYLPDKTQFQISWIGSFSSFCLFLFAAPGGFLADKVGPIIPISVGCVLELLAVFMISLCREYYQFFLAQGVLLGIGMSLIAFPTSVVVPMYFKRNRGLAQGMSIAGSSLGGVLWPIIFDQLLNHNGVSFGWTLRIAGFMMLPLMVLVLLTLRKPKQPINKKDEETESVAHEGNDKPEKKKKDLSALKQPAFILLCLGLALAFFGFFAPLFYVSVYAVSKGVSESTAFYILSALNGASLFGRILPGYFADRHGHFNTLIVAIFGSAIVAFCWTAAISLAGIIVWAITYGFISGAILSLQLACATDLIAGESFGAGVGIAMTSVSLTGLFGTPIAGELEQRGYLALSCWSAATLIAGGIAIVAARFAREKRLWMRV